jgi:signal transduction histidine kinase
LGAIGLLLAATAGAVAIANTGSDRRYFLAAVGAVSVAALIAAALYTWRNDPANRFGRLLLPAGFAAFLTTFGASDNELLYSVGRVSGWLFELLLVYLFLAYPSGRLQTGAEKWIFLVAAAQVVVLWLPTAFLVDHFPTPWPTCISDCPGNALQVTSSEPGFIESVVRPARELITLGVWIAAAVVLARKLSDSSPATRRGLAPVLSVLIFRLVSVVAFMIARRAGAGDAAMEVISALVLLSVPAALVGFIVGRLQWQLYSARALQSLADDGGSPTLDALRERLAAALGDPTLEIRYPVADANGGWRNASGRPAPVPDQSTDRCVVSIETREGPLAAIVCDPALEDHRALVEASASWIRAGMERERLTAALNASLRDVEASRRRISAAGASERRRIERDLHDGAQQQLVTLRIQLELVADELERSPHDAARRLRELGPSIDAVIEEVRSLARGIFPSLLADAGLGEALRAAGARATLPVTVEADGLRYPLEVESAIYFCCLEALQNAAKHAGASAVSIDLKSTDDRLHFAVQDDGHGFDPLDASHNGSGLTNMNDRLAAIGGRLVVESAVGRGTRITGEVPAAPIA